MSVPPFQPRLALSLSSVAPFLKSFLRVALARVPLCCFRIIAPVEGPTALLQSYHWGSVSTSYPILALCVYLPRKAGEEDSGVYCASALSRPSISLMSEERRE